MKQPVHSSRGGGYQKSFQRNGRNNDSDWANNGGGGGYGHGAGGGPGGYQNSSKHRGQDYRGGFQQNNDSASADWSQGHNGGYQKRGSRNSYKDEFRSQNGGVSVLFFGVEMLCLLTSLPELHFSSFFDRVDNTIFFEIYLLKKYCF